MLRTAPIRSKVIAVLAVPLAGLLALAAAGIGTTVGRGAEAHRVNDLAQLAVRGDTLVHELQAERTLSSGWVAGRANRVAVPRDGMVTQRVVVDRDGLGVQGLRRRAGYRRLRPEAAPGPRPGGHGP